MDIDIGSPTMEEVEKAIGMMKNGKTTEADEIHVEMLKADIKPTAKVLTGLFMNIWTKDTIPKD